MLRFLAYLGRWQLSSIVLIPVIAMIADPVWSAIVGNFIGGCIFWHVDKMIFKKKDK